MEYEYNVAHVETEWNYDDGSYFKEPFDTRKDAEDWLQNEAKFEDVPDHDFYLIRRPVARWERVTDLPPLKRPKPTPGVVWASPLSKRNGW